MKHSFPVILFLPFLVCILVYVVGIESVFSADSRFSVSKQGTILDSKTNLEWIPDQGVNVLYNEANNYVRKLAFGGHNDWRLPTREELVNLYDPSLQTNQKIDHLFHLTVCDVWSSEKADCLTPTLWAFSFGGCGFEGWFGCGKLPEGTYYDRPLQGTGHILAVRSMKIIN